MCMLMCIFAATISLILLLLPISVGVCVYFWESKIEKMRVRESVCIYSFSFLGYQENTYAYMYISLRYLVNRIG